MTTFEIIEAAWNALPRSGSGGRVFVCVDSKTGKIYPVFEPQGTIVPASQHEEEIFSLRAGSQSEIISDWVLDEHILDMQDIENGLTRYDLSEEELYSCVLDVLHEWFEKDIYKRIEEIQKENPHLA